MTNVRGFVVVGWLACACFAGAAPPQLAITEFMAINTSTLKDSDNEYSDWIEIQNISTQTVNAAGWALTDSPTNLTRWTFPSNSIAPGACVVVFASGKDRRTPGSQLHTDFKLTGSGEYLALFPPGDTNPATIFSPTFPEQFADISYGNRFTFNATGVLVEAGAACRYRVPTNDIGTNWVGRSYDDSAWSSGQTGLGYRFADLVGTDILSAMPVPLADCYARVPFFVENPAAVEGLILRMRCDDGYIAWVNGRRIAAANSPDPVFWNSTATAENTTSPPVPSTNYAVASSGLLVAGTNFLAIHGLNRETSATRRDFLVLPQLSACNLIQSIDYLPYPSPGADNRNPQLPSVRFAPEQGSYTGTVTVALSLDGSDASIRYTTNGTEPSTNSTLYTGPISVLSDTMIRARAFASDMPAGPICSGSYLILASDLRTFTSDLPLIVVDNFGAADIPDIDPKQQSCVAIYEPVNGRTSLTNAPTVITRAGIRRRGETSLRATSSKPNLALETWGEGNDDRDISLLGLPAGSDWVLHAPYDYDRTLLHHTLSFELSRQMGEYAPRTRYAEVFIKASSGTLSYAAHYAGVYVLMERVKQGDERVDVEEMSASDKTEPEVSGGYIFKRDKDDVDAGSFVAGGQTLWYVYPTYTDITTNQAAWLRNYINAFTNALYGSNYRNPTTGYRAYIEADTWIRSSILNTTVLNIDWPSFSTFMYKPRSGKIRFGPIWDVDRALESCGDSRDDNYNVWSNPDWNKFALYWWGRLFQDPDFWQMWVDTWQDLRGSTLSTSNTIALIAGFTNQIGEAQARNFVKWGAAVPPRFGGWQGEVANMRTWLTNRLQWISSQFPAQPLFSLNDSIVSNGQSFAMVSTNMIYYTLDGSDPRAAGGLPATNAILYAGPISLTNSALLKARSYTGQPWLGATSNTVWSGPVQTLLVTAPARLTLTEVMYHPRPPTAGELLKGFSTSDFEFLEFRNDSEQTGSLLGMRLADGADFDFTTNRITSLAPGEYVLLVRNLAAFTNRYPDWAGMNIAGEYDGNLDDSGERVAIGGLTNGATGDYLQFRYSDARFWPQSADGGGHSLVPRVFTNQNAELVYPGNWRASAFRDGSPGTADPEPQSDVVLNEITAHTDISDTNFPGYDSNDWIELFNRSESPVSLADWYLSDDAADLAKWAIPTNVVLDPHGFAAFDEITGFHAPLTNGFGLFKGGEAVFLSYLPTGAVGEVVDCIRYKGQENGHSLGRWHDGEDAWVAMLPSRGAPNTGPLADVSIRSVMYHPAPTAEFPEDNTKHEYVELFNRTGSPAALWTVGGPWRLDGDATLAFPTNLWLSAGKRLLMVPFAPTNHTLLTSLLTVYGATDRVEHILGPWTGSLPNNSGRVAVERPLLGDLPGEDIAWVVVDEVVYFNQSPWPVEADGGGEALLRTDPGAAGNSSVSWEAATPDPDTDRDGLPDAWEMKNFGGLSVAEGAPDQDPDGDGALNIEEEIAGTCPTNGADAFVFSAAVSDEFHVVSFETRTPDDTAIPGTLRFYSVEGRTDLTSESWFDIPDRTNLPATGLPYIFTNTAETPIFYRGRVWTSAP